MNWQDKIYESLMEQCKNCDDEGVAAGQALPKGTKRTTRIDTATTARRKAQIRRHGKRTGTSGRMGNPTFPGGAENPPSHAHADSSLPSELGKKKKKKRG